MRRNVVQISRYLDTDEHGHRVNGEPALVFEIRCPHGYLQHIDQAWAFDQMRYPEGAEQAIFFRLDREHARKTLCDCERPYRGIDDMAVAERCPSDHLIPEHLSGRDRVA